MAYAYSADRFWHDRAAGFAAGDQSRRDASEQPYRDGCIQDAYDKGEYSSVEKKVYAFAEKAGDQDYWLAKAFITLGDSFAEQENYKQAKATFESVLNGYTPAEGTSDDVLDNVRMRLAKLKNLM